MKDKSTIIVIVLLVFVVVFASQIQNVISKTGHAVVSCTDSDGGDNINVKGTVSIITSSGTSRTYDRCIDTNVGAKLMEYNCPADTTSTLPTSKTYTCVGSCITGACKQQNECSPSGSKVCKSSTQYKVCGNYDSDSFLEYTLGSCPTGSTCANGVCIPCTDSDGGKNYYVKGTVVFRSISNINIDTCRQTQGGINLPSGPLLVELFCNNDGGLGVNYFNCTSVSKVCQNGACI